MSSCNRVLAGAFVLVTLTLAPAAPASASSMDQVATQARG